MLFSRRRIKVRKGFQSRAICRGFLQSSLNPFTVETHLVFDMENITATGLQWQELRIIALMITMYLLRNLHVLDHQPQYQTGYSEYTILKGSPDSVFIWRMILFPYSTFVFPLARRPGFRILILLVMLSMARLFHLMMLDVK